MILFLVPGMISNARSQQTPVSESSYFVHMDPLVFPSPESFDPARWLRAAANGERLDKFIVSFTKGSRKCLGIK
jgi:cytochrome P450